MNETTDHSSRFWRTVTAFSAGSLLVGALTACGADAVPAAAPAASTFPPSTPSVSSAAVPVPVTDPILRMISNGDHKLAFHVTPGKLPAIVLDAGGGADSSYWKELAPTLARETGSEIISYDRAGMGASDEVPGPWKVEDAVSDLETGLKELGATKDVMLVSHSLAGEVATYFVNKNPNWVTGAVLVDASLPNLYTDGVVSALEAANQAQVAELEKQPSTKQTRQLQALATNYGPMHRAYHKVSWPDNVPATVIVSSKTPFETPGEAQLWRDAQAQFAGASPNRSLVVAENSSHEIPLDRPDVVINAVNDLAKKLR
jgi:pimeloyl-ACP methyl ester carboxylesterase